MSAAASLDGEKSKQVIIEVEVVQRDGSNLARQNIETEVDQFLRAKEYISSDSKISQFGAEYSLLCVHVECVQLCLEEQGENRITMIHLPSAQLI